MMRIFKLVFVAWVIAYSETSISNDLPGCSYNNYYERDTKVGYCEISILDWIANKRTVEGNIVVSSLVAPSQVTGIQLSYDESIFKLPGLYKESIGIYGEGVQNLIELIEEHPDDVMCAKVWLRAFKGYDDYRLSDIEKIEIFSCELPQ